MNSRSSFRNVAFDLVMTDEWDVTCGVRPRNRDPAIDLCRPDVGIRHRTEGGADGAGRDVDAAVDSRRRTRWGPIGSKCVDVNLAAR